MTNQEKTELIELKKYLKSKKDRSSTEYYLLLHIDNLKQKGE
jgi:hypothetical protein